MTGSVDVNGRRYEVPKRPIVVVCVDGNEPDYHWRALAAGRTPYLAETKRSGVWLDADSAMPSFTNPNNLSIATGVSPALHGICGNYFFDADHGVEVMMNDPAFLRVPTIFAALERAGVGCAVITAKDKLRRLLGHGLERGVCFSAEKADQVTEANNRISGVLDLVGRPVPDVYSADLSEFVMAAGVQVLRTRRPSLMYLSLTDYIQHKYEPGHEVADDFYAMLDGYLAELDALGATIVVTGDHGMNAKTGADATPNIVYVQQLLDEWLGSGRARVILPITDPYTAHHGALGSFAHVYVDAGVEAKPLADRLAAVAGIEEVLPRAQACDRYELPVDRSGDLTIVAARHVVLGTSPERHDLSQLDRPLRSHGGLTEQRVPMIVNRALRPRPPEHRLRNFDAFWLALNFVE